MGSSLDQFIMFFKNIIGIGLGLIPLRRWLMQTHFSQDLVPFCADTALCWSHVALIFCFSFKALLRSSIDLC